MTDARARAEKLAAEAIPLHDWDEYNQMPVDTYGYPETERQGFVKGYLAAKVEPVTVSAEKFKAMASAADDENGNLFDPDELVSYILDAAGIRVEGDGDE